MIACSEALYNVRLLRGSLQGWLAPRLTTGIARSKALSWPASRLVHFKALYEACSKDLYEARSLGGLLGGLLQGSLAPRLSTNLLAQSSIRGLH